MDSRVKKKLWKIRNKKTGLFSNGGKTPKFTKNGKIWTCKGHLRLHLHQFSEYELQKVYKDCEVVSYGMEEIDCKKVI